MADEPVDERVELICPDCGFEDKVPGHLIELMGMPICPRVSCGVTQLVNKRADHSHTEDGADE